VRCDVGNVTNTCISEGPDIWEGTVVAATQLAGGKLTHISSYCPYASQQPHVTFCMQNGALKRAPSVGAYANLSELQNGCLTRRSRRLLQLPALKINFFQSVGQSSGNLSVLSQ
jgi:hypothetical protein